MPALALQRLLFFFLVGFYHCIRAINGTVADNAPLQTAFTLPPATIERIRSRRFGMYSYYDTVSRSSDTDILIDFINRYNMALSTSTVVCLIPQSSLLFLWRRWRRERMPPFTFFLTTPSQLPNQIVAFNADEEEVQVRGGAVAPSTWNFSVSTPFEIVPPFLNKYLSWWWNSNRWTTPIRTDGFRDCQGAPESAWPGLARWRQFWHRRSVWRRLHGPVCHDAEQLE